MKKTFTRNIAGILFGLAVVFSSAAAGELRMGVYIYDYAVRKTAKESGEDLKTFAEKHFRILRKNHVNTIHLTVNRADGKEFREIWLPLMKKYGIKAYLQLDFAYYHEPEIKDKWTEKEENRKAQLAAEFIRRYQAEPAILAFSIREEVHHAYVNGMARYYQKILAHAPGFKIVTVHSGLGAAKDHPVPDPAVFGTDRYCFWWEFSGEGYLASPASALNWLRSQTALYQAEAAKRGADFLLVVTANTFVSGRTYSETAWNDIRGNGKLQKRIARYTREKRFGWNLDKVNGQEFNWVWKWYKPPVNCTRAMIWTGILEGARAVLFWSYRPAGKNEPGTPAELLARDLARRQARNPKQNRANGSWSTMADRPGEFNQPMEEFAAAALELKPYSRLICMMTKLPDSPVKTDRRKKIFNRAFSIPTYQGKIIVIHNADVGSWGKNSPVMFDENSDIKVDSHGNLVGYKPFTSPRKVDFTCSAKAAVFDFATGRQLELKDGKGTVEILPGGGTMLFVGSRQEFDRLKKAAAVK